MSGAPRIAATVIGGFLGAGKTTLINRWLQAPDQARVMVLVNDFGETNIDAELIADRNADTIALTNGCVCCQTGGDLSQALIRVMDGARQWDEIWIEASGVSDPARVARLVAAVPECELRGVMVVVDVGAIDSQLQDPLLRDTLLAQILAADALLLSKSDRVHGEAFASATALVRDINAHALCVSSDRYGAMAALIKNWGVFTAIPKIWTPEPGHARRFSAWMGHPVVTRSVQEWHARLRALPPQVIRLKGFVRTHEHGWSRIQLAHAQVDIQPCAAPQGTGEVLVAIALRGNLPREQLEELT